MKARTKPIREKSKKSSMSPIVAANAIFHWFAVSDFCRSRCSNMRPPGSDPAGGVPAGFLVVPDALVVVEACRDRSRPPATAPPAGPESLSGPPSRPFVPIPTKRSGRGNSKLTRLPSISLFLCCREARVHRHVCRVEHALAEACAAGGGNSGGPAPAQRPGDGGRSRAGFATEVVRLVASAPAQPGSAAARDHGPDGAADPRARGGQRVCARALSRARAARRGGRARQFRALGRDRGRPVAVCGFGGFVRRLAGGRGAAAGGGSG